MLEGGRGRRAVQATWAGCSLGGRAHQKDRGEGYGEQTHGDNEEAPLLRLGGVGAVPDGGHHCPHEEQGALKVPAKRRAAEVTRLDQHVNGGREETEMPLRTSSGNPGWVPSPWNGCTARCGW